MESGGDLCIRLDRSPVRAEGLGSRSLLCCEEIVASCICNPLGDKTYCRSDVLSTSSVSNLRGVSCFLFFDDGGASFDVLSFQKFTMLWLEVIMLAISMADSSRKVPFLILFISQIRS